MDAHSVAATLRAICRNDATRYDHHERRAWDGRRPAEEGGDIWRSPREMAAGMLRRMHRAGLIAEAETLWDLSDAAIAERLAATQAVST